MDRLIKRFAGERDGDLIFCRDRGIAYQRKMESTQPYDSEYFDHYRNLEGGEIARKLNEARVGLVARHYGDGPLLDVGIGSGEFIRSRGANTFGTDVNPVALSWLDERALLRTDLTEFEAFTFWDVLEHFEEPEVPMRSMRPGSYLFTSLPIFDDLDRIRQSKHYKPGEHLYYWTEQGFVDWMALHRWRLLERNDDETRAGREGILSFAFRRDLPDYHSTLGQYQELHSAAYGTSAHLHFEAVAKEVLSLNPKTILDYGCGRSDIAAHFWNDGKRQIVKYDPAIPDYKELPIGPFDVVLCLDVLEHILMTDVDRIFAEIRKRSRKVIFTISLRPSRAELPDGRNAHVTLLKAGEWLAWIGKTFGAAQEIPTPDPGEIMVKTWA